MLLDETRIYPIVLEELRTLIVDKQKLIPMDIDKILVKISQDDIKKGGRKHGTDSERNGLKSGT